MNGPCGTVDDIKMTNNIVEVILINFDSNAVGFNPAAITINPSVQKKMERLIDKQMTVAPQSTHNECSPWAQRGYWQPSCEQTKTKKVGESFDLGTVPISIIMGKVI